MVQNNAARLIVKQSQMDHITPTLIKLHWLPVKYRIEFQILLLVYKCVTGVAPSYLASLIPPYIPGRSGLGSASSNQRAKQITKKKYGDRAFSNSGPHLWNNINLDYYYYCNLLLVVFTQSRKTLIKVALVEQRSCRILQIVFFIVF